MAHILIVNNAERGIREFAEPIEKIIEGKGSTCVFIEYEDCLNADFKLYDGVVMTGSPQGDDIVEHHSPFFWWIKNCKVPVFGICAGHHITGYIYGAEILRSIESESGDFQVELLKEDPILKGISSTIKVRQMHNDSITLPKDFVLLGSSKNCKNQLMKHKQRPVYTAQFHPEYYNHDLIGNFISICDNYSD